MKKIFFHKLKLYQIIFLSSILGFIITLNSNYVNEQKSKSNLNKSKTKNNLYNSQRSLEEITYTERKLSNDLYESNQICSKASNELKEYYKTSDISKIVIDNGEDFSETDKNYIKALIDIANCYYKQRN